MIIKRIFTVILLASSLTALAAKDSPPIQKSSGLNFEQNKGQFHPSVKFLARGEGYQVAFGEMPVIELLDGIESDTNQVDNKAKPLTFGIDIQGANKSSKVVGVDQLILKTNYIHGQAGQWITDANNYAKVKYLNVLDGIDAVYYGNQGRLEYDFVVKPGIDYKQIQVGFNGADNVSIAEDGGLWIHLGDKKLKQLKPIVYQIDTAGTQQTIAANYKIANKLVKFELGEYDTTRELIIDPVIDYASYYGGTGYDRPYNIDVDAADNIYMMSRTSSAGMATMGSYNEGTDSSRASLISFPFCQGCTDGGPDPNVNSQVERSSIGRAFTLLFTKFSPDGQTQLYATYLSSSVIGLRPSVNSMAVSDAGELGFGVTGVDGLPLVNETQVEGGAYIAKLNTTGNGLVFATYLDIGGYSWVRGLDVAADGSLALSGFLLKSFGSHNFPEVNSIPGQSCAYTQDYEDYTDMYVAFFSNSGDLEFSSCLGGDSPGTGFTLEYARSIAIGNNGNLYVLGASNMTNFPVVNGFQTQLSDINNRDNTITVINPSTSQIIYSSYYGPSVLTNIVQTGEVVNNNPSNRNEFYATKILVDSNDDVIITGITTHAGLGTKNAHQPNLRYLASYQSDYFGGSKDFFDIYVTKIDLVNGIEWSTYLGGNGLEQGFNDMVVDSSDNIYIHSITNSDDYPVLNAIQSMPSGKSSAVLSKLTPAGALAFSTYLDGNESTKAQTPGGVVINSQNKIILGGYAESDSYPITPNGAPRVGGFDGTLAILNQSADTDSDGDGVPDVVDDFPADNTEWIDTDGDLTGDNADVDDDQDGVPDVNDFFPKDDNETIDSDADGVGDNADEFPNDATEVYDTDGDGEGDVADLDSDNDTYPDNVDAFIFDDTEGLDTDGDGVGNNADLDNDGDGFDDMVDPDPLNAQNPVMNFQSFNPGFTAAYKSPLPTGFSQLIGTDKAWTADTSDSYSDRTSMGSWVIGDNETAGLQYDGDFEAGTIGFWYKVDSEAGADLFTFAIDGNVIYTDSGNSGWLLLNVPISAGNHTLTWQYSKNGAVSMGDDGVRIDNLTGFPTDPVELSVNITDNTPSDGLPAGEQITYTVTVSNNSANGTTDASVNVSLPDSSQLSNVSWTCNGGFAAECQTVSGRSAGNSINLLIDFFYLGDATIEITGDVTTSEVPVAISAGVSLTTDSRDTNPSDNSQVVTNQVGIFAHGFE